MKTEDDNFSVVDDDSSCEFKEVNASIPDIPEWMLAHALSPYEKKRRSDVLHKCIFAAITLPALLSVSTFLLLMTEVWVPEFDRDSNGEVILGACLIGAFAFSVVAFAVYAVFILVKDYASKRRNRDEPGMIYNMGVDALHGGLLVKEKDINKAIHHFKKAASLQFEPAKRALAYFEGYGFVAQD